MNSEVGLSREEQGVGAQVGAAQVVVPAGLRVPTHI